MNHSALSEPVSGRQRYERVLDEAFRDAALGLRPSRFPDAIALLDERTYHYFDVRGVTRDFDLAIHDSGWTMIRRDEDFWQRSAGRFRGNDAIDGTGENSSDSGAT